MFGEKLKELRIEKGLSQKQLSAILLCSQSMIARWENGECDATGEIIKRTAIYFNVTADFLLGIGD